MPQKWLSLGRILDPASIAGRPSWMAGYASVPFIEYLNGDHIKIYFSVRNHQGHSLTTWALFDFSNPSRIRLVEWAFQPVLPLGRHGEFDHHGVMGCHITEIGHRRYLYYIGWNRGTEVPFRNAIGIAEQASDGTFRRIFRGPILDRSIYDPCFVASNSIIPIRDQWVMYYLSCDRWERSKGRMHPFYNIKIATSTDGIHWQRQGRIAINYQHAGEHAIAVPRVLYDPPVYKMWYSYRTYRQDGHYLIGYAESDDGFEWERKDEEISFMRSGKQWDAEMICYPFVFDHQGRRYMLYNGNGYGKTGIGLAVLAS